MFRSVNGGVWNIHTFFDVPVDSACRLAHDGLGRAFFAAEMQQFTSSVDPDVEAQVAWTPGV